jgi:hypothetical protein
LWNASRSPFQIEWRDKKLDHWLRLPRAQQGGRLTYNLRCEICDLAWELGISEEQFYKNYSKLEREQLLATYRSKAKRASVVAMFPQKRK